MEQNRERTELTSEVGAKTLFDLGVIASVTFKIKKRKWAQVQICDREFPIY